MKYYHTPTGSTSRLFIDCLNQSHLLIAGATGSGKSCFENGLITAALYSSPADVRFIFIDPKGTELDIYKDLPHTIQYAQTSADSVQALQYAAAIVEARFKDMRRRHIRTYDGSHVYIIIDELMYLMNRPTVKRQIYDLLQDLLCIARAAAVSIIAITQNPTRDTLPPSLRCNFDARIGLRTATRQDSRNIIEMGGCEKLPNPRTTGRAYGYYRHGGDIDLYQLPYTSEDEITRLVNYWTSSAGRPRTA